MFAGHIGVALALGRAERGVNVGIFVCAAMLLDFVLWIMVLLHGESVTIPTDFMRTHQPRFDFPYSHGLAAGIGWSALAAAAMLVTRARSKAAAMRAAGFVAAAVFSHWLLDALVHAPELPLAGSDSIKVGLGLWQRMPLALALEAAVAVSGLCLFVSGAAISAARKIALSVLTLCILAFTIAGMTVAPPPPSVFAMAATSLAMIIVVGALFCWLGRRTGTNDRTGASR
jgi:hypothetical protein